MIDLDAALAALTARKVYSQASGVFECFDGSGVLIVGGSDYLRGTHGALLYGALVREQQIGGGGGSVFDSEDDYLYEQSKRRAQEQVIAALLVAICTSGILDSDADMTIRFN